MQLNWIFEIPDCGQIGGDFEQKAEKWEVLCDVIDNQQTL